MKNLGGPFREGYNMPPRSRAKLKHRARKLLEMASYRSNIIFSGMPRCVNNNPIRRRLNERTKRVYGINLGSL
jgi:hypothetical protein